MKRTFAVLGVLAMAFAQSASAVATAEIHVTHVTQGFYTSDPGTPTITSSVDTNISISSVSGTPPNNQISFDIPGLQTYSLIVGQTQFIDYSYSITVSDQGQLATAPISSYCAPLGIGCFGASSVAGREVAWAELFVGYQDPRSAHPPGVTVTGAMIPLVTSSDAFPDFLTASGIARASFLTSNPDFTSVTAGFFEFAFADGGPAPIPEPATYGLLLMGLVGVAARRQRDASPQRSCTDAQRRSAFVAYVVD